MTRKDRRRFTRVDVVMEITLQPKHADPAKKDLKDISLGGAFVMHCNDLPEGTECTLSIQISGRSGSLRAEVEGEVVRTDENGMAVRFTNVDLDSLLNLQQLLKANSKTPQTIDDEIETSFGK
jgi:c-di-GMP-binding flagellar brake protein YcgR